MSSLSQWVDQSTGEFSGDEARRAKHALGFLTEQTKPASVMEPRVTKSSLLWTVIPAVALFLFGLILGQTPGADAASALLPMYVLVVPGILIFFACFVALSVGWPKWIRTLAIVVGGISWLWLNALGGSFMRNNGTHGFTLFLIFTVLLVLFIVAIRKGMKR